jgi:hypothetical protein
MTDWEWRVRELEPLGRGRETRIGVKLVCGRFKSFGDLHEVQASVTKSRLHV